MPLLTIIIVLALFGALLWVINVKVGFLSSGWKMAINIVAVLVVGIWLLKVLGVWGYLNQVHA
jgi:hypothetical protein